MAGLYQQYEAAYGGRGKYDHYQNIPTSSTKQHLTDGQATQSVSIYVSYAQAIAANVTYISKGGVTQTFQAAQASIGNVGDMFHAYSGVQATPAGFCRIAADNTSFTYPDLRGLAAGMGVQDWAAFQKLQGYKVQIKAAQTLADVQAVVSSRS